MRISILKKCINNILIKISGDFSGNSKYNRILWNRYSSKWNAAKVKPEDPLTTTSQIQYLGDEWGSRASVEDIIREFILSFVSTESRVAEFGVGGGRIATRVAKNVGFLDCFDISKSMLRRAKEELRSEPNITFHLIKSREFSSAQATKYDFIYLFDVMVHMDLHTMRDYLSEFHKMLKPSGKIFIHTSNLTSPEGWARFRSQRDFSVEGHYFVSPELVRTLATQSGYEVIKESIFSRENFYYARDYLAVLKKTPVDLTNPSSQ